MVAVSSWSSHSSESTASAFSDPTAKSGRAHEFPGCSGKEAASSSSSEPAIKRAREEMDHSRRDAKL